MRRVTAQWSRGYETLRTRPGPDRAGAVRQRYASDLTHPHILQVAGLNTPYGKTYSSFQRGQVGWRRQSNRGHRTIVALTNRFRHDAMAVMAHTPAPWCDNPSPSCGRPDRTSAEARPGNGGRIGQSSGGAGTCGFTGRINKADADSEMEC